MDRAQRERRVRRWVVTCNNPPHDVSSYLEELEPELTYGGGREEVGESGTFHWQGFLCFDNGRGLTLSQLISRTEDIMPGAHFEPMKGTVEHNVWYCSCEEGEKGGQILSEFRSVGTPPAGQGKRMDLVAVADAVVGGATVEHLFAEYPSAMYRYGPGIERHVQLLQRPRDGTEEIKILLLLGPSGIGKSRLVREQFPDAYWKPASNKWWPGYNGEKTVVFDDFNGSWVPYELLLRILDRYDCNVENKGGNRALLATVFIITSNREPDEWYCESVWKNAHCRTWESSALRRRIHQNSKCLTVRQGEIPRFFEERRVYLPYPSVHMFAPDESIVQMSAAFGDADQYLIPRDPETICDVGGSQVGSGAELGLPDARRNSEDLEWEPVSQDEDVALKESGFRYGSVWR